MTSNKQFHRIVFTIILLVIVSPAALGTTDYGPLDGVSPPYAIDSHQYFGQVIAVESDYFVIGAPRWTTPEGSGVGAIMIAAPDEAGTWRPVAWEEGPEPDRLFPLFGLSISASGERFMVGAPGAEVDGPKDNGQAYVYRFESATQTIEQTHVIDRPEAETGSFGSRVGLDGDWMAISAVLMRGGSDGGAVFVYQMEAATGDWVLHQKLMPPDFDQQEIGLNYFGDSMSLNYPWLLIHASSPYLEAENGKGALYIYRHDSDTDEWQFHQKLTDDFDLDFNLAGRRPVISNDWLLFYSQERVDDGLYLHGRLHVYQFSQDDDLWVREGILTSPLADPERNNNFAWSYRKHGDHLYVGNPNLRGAIDGDTRGAVWVFERDESAENGWISEGYLQAPYNADVLYDEHDSFGNSLALMENGQLLIGATRMPLYGLNRVGMVWRYGPDAPQVRLQWSDAGLEGEAVTDEPFTQLIRIDNSGDTAATNVRFHFTRHPQLQLTDTNVSCWDGPEGDQYGCLIPHVPADGHFILELEFESEQAWQFDISADMQSDQLDQAPDERAGEWSIQVAEAPAGGGGSSSGSGCSLGRGPWEVLLLLALAGLAARQGRWAVAR